MPHPTTYDAYAPVYDATGQGAVGAALAGLALERARALGAAPRDALDLCCGAGASALALAAAGLRVTGVDRAPAMLAIAAGRARGAGADVRLLEADARAPRARLGRRASFDLVTCLDAAHELAGGGDLRRLALAAARSLRPGGHLALDLRTPAYFAARLDSDEALHDGPGHMVAAQLDADDDGRVWGRRVVWFVREIDRWWRGEESHPLRAWAEAELLAVLGAAGLELVERQPLPGQERALYVARRA